LVRALTQYPVGAAAVARIQGAQALAIEPEDSGAAPAGSGPATVSFVDVRFRYRPELPEVHNGVSFEVPAGGMTAFVGPSGAGKTTVFSLIERFYEPDTGQVLVDGVDVGRWPLRGLRATIGYVEQDASVLSGSLRENLLYAAPDASADELA